MVVSKNTELPILLLLTNYLVKQKYLPLLKHFNINFTEVHNTSIVKPILMNTNFSSFTYHSKVTHMSIHSFAVQFEYWEQKLTCLLMFLCL